MEKELQSRRTEPLQQSVNPELIRIPRVRERDPVFGQTRAFWYKAESMGLIRLKRFRLSGAKNGVTCIPVNEGRAMFAKLSSEEGEA